MWKSVRSCKPERMEYTRELARIYLAAEAREGRQMIEYQSPDAAGKQFSPSMSSLQADCPSKPPPVDGAAERGFPVTHSRRLSAIIRK